jgi:hypothetical protein
MAKSKLSAVAPEESTEGWLMTNKLLASLDTEDLVRLMGYVSTPGLSPEDVLRHVHSLASYARKAGMSIEEVLELDPLGNHLRYRDDAPTFIFPPHPVIHVQHCDVCYKAEETSGLKREATLRWRLGFLVLGRGGPVSALRWKLNLLRRRRRSRSGP